MSLNNLSLLSILLGVGFALPQVYGLVKPAAYGEALRKFPRNEPIGFALMLAGTLWFLWNVKTDPIADFAAFKPAMLVGFGIVGVGTCFFVKDFLAVRGLAVVVLLLAKVVLDSARWVDTQWRLVVVVWAYVWIVSALWYSISPWRLRDLIQFTTASEQRTRLFSALRLALGILVAVLGMTVFRQASS